jgi:hypothetical protein
MESRTFATLSAVVSIRKRHHCESVSINIGCGNTDSQIQGDEDADALTAQQTFPVIKLEYTASPPPPEEIWGNDINDDGDGSSYEDCPPETCIECFTEFLMASNQKRILG